MSIPLRDLDATLLWKLKTRNGRTTFAHGCESLTKAQGIMFLCPKCFIENGRSNVGVHSVLCWFVGRGVPDDVEPLPGRWTPSGTSIENLTFVPPPGSVSVQLLGGCNWHGFIIGGAASLT